jgi:hypothetical protein
MIRAVCIAAAGAIVLAAPGNAQDDSASADLVSPLFTAHELLQLTIEAPLNTIFKERGQESSYHDAVMKFAASDGTPVTLGIELKTRGKFRLQRSTCNFPPIRVNFARKEVENTVFAGQDKLKLVTHCQNGRDDYEQHVLLEHLIYRTYNLLTDLSFRTRLARITYVDTDDDNDSLTKYAFFIEDEDLLAEQRGWQSLELMQVPPVAYDQRQLSLVDVFQFMVGNTDWDAYKKDEEQPSCCHNVKVIGDPAGPVFPVAYDFDWTGLVNSRYARPDESLGTRSVRQRVFRGVCGLQQSIDAVLPLFIEQREAIYRLFQGQEGLDEKHKEESIEYLDEFYEIINDSRKVEREMIRDCRRIGE